MLVTFPAESKIGTVTRPRNISLPLRSRMPRAFSFSMTSPPYMAKDDLSDPFTDYRAKGQGYSAYLREMRSIYGQLRQLMKPAATVVVEIANLKIDGRVTTLAWDVAEEISTVLRFEGEVVVCWDKYGYGYDHSYCLVYSAL